MFDTLYKLAAQFRRDRHAVTAMEYGLIAALIAVALITILGTLGTKLAGVFTSIQGALP